MFSATVVAVKYVCTRMVGRMLPTVCPAYLPTCLPAIPILTSTATFTATPPPHPHTSPSLLHPHRRRRRLPPLHHPPRGRVFTRAAEDGNVVVATGPKPPPSPPLPPPPSNTGGEKAASDTATLLWQSGPIRSLERSANPSDRTCKKCQLKVGRDGRVVVARGKEELAVFSSSSVRKLKAFFLVEGGD